MLRRRCLQEMLPSQKAVFHFHIFAVVERGHWREGVTRQKQVSEVYQAEVLTRQKGFQNSRLPALVVELVAELAILTALLYELSALVELVAAVVAVVAVAVVKAYLRYTIDHLVRLLPERGGRSHPDNPWFECGPLSFGVVSVLMNE